MLSSSQSWVDCGRTRRAVNNLAAHVIVQFTLETFKDFLEQPSFKLRKGNKVNGKRGWGQGQRSELGKRLSCVAAAHLY